MSLLFGCSCNQPQRLAEALAPVRHTLVAKAPVALWGLGYVQAGEVLLSRTPRSSSRDVDLYEPVAALRSDYVIGHASSSGELTGNANTQPFRFRHWMFAAQATKLRGADTEAAIDERIPVFLRRNMRGKSGAEQLFHLYLASLHQAGALDDPALPPAEARRALASALGILSRIAGPEEAEGLGNLILSNSRSMLALRLGEAMYTRRLKIPARKKETETFKGVLVVSCERDPGEGFEDIPPRSVLTIGRDLRTDIAALD